MNDRHPSGYSLPADTSPGVSYAGYGDAQYEQPAYESYAQPGAQSGYSTGYDGYATGTFDNLALSYGDGDPLFGALPGADTSTGTGQYTGAGHAAQQGYDGYTDTGAMWAAGSGIPLGADVPAQAGPGQTGNGYDHQATGQWDASAWDSGQWDTTGWNTGSWDTTQWNAAEQPGTAQTARTDQAADTAQAYGYDAGYAGYEQAQQHPLAETGVLPPLADEPGATTAMPAFDEHGYEGGYDAGAGYPADGTAVAAGYGHDADAQDHDHGFDPGYDHGLDAGFDPGHDDGFAAEEADDGTEQSATGSGAAGTGGAGPAATISSRGRRRSPKPRRSALLTVAVPSVCVMGVAGAAAASVMGDGEGSSAQASDATTAQTTAANSKLDTQLAGLSADADDFADRASRTQERLDLKKRQEEEKKRKAAEAARKEAMRPKFLLPVKQHGLSARFGQAGVNWMSVHTGIDFPVQYGTPVMAATDGTVTTKYNVAYGNMAIVTAPDGTQTWYCHLSSTKIRSGSVKAGQVIAYSGSSGNSTGPHLHFEVRPGGGAAIDPLPWLRSHGLNPL